MKGCIVNRKYFEKIAAKFDSLNETPDVFIDVGVGGPYPYEAWWFKEYWPYVGVIGYEPCNERFQKLIPTAFRYHDDTDHLVGIEGGGGFPGWLQKEVVADVDGVYAGYMNNYDFRIKKDVDEEDPYKKVNMLSVTVDTLITNRLKMQNDEDYKFKNVFVWADIEGGELTLLKGATQCLEEKRILGLNLELWPNPSIKEWPSSDEIVEYLEKFDYHIAFGEDCSYNDWDRVSQKDFLFVPNK